MSEHLEGNKIHGRVTTHDTTASPGPDPGSLSVATTRRPSNAYLTRKLRTSTARKSVPVSRNPIRHTANDPQSAALVTPVDQRRDYQKMELEQTSLQN